MFIDAEYPTIERFCFENDLNKSTMSRLLTKSGEEFQVKTLAKIAKAAGMCLRITAE